MNYIIRNERKDELNKVEDTIREAFWDVYKPGCDEHLMAHQLHKSDAFVEELDYVAECDGQIIGNIICSKGVIKNNTTEHVILCIGPIGVIPEYQGKGVGSSLMRMALDRAKDLGFPGVVLYGNPKYYHRFGFDNAGKYQITTPHGDNFEEFMALELLPGSLEGILGKCFEDKAFEINSADLEKFEMKFKTKEKRHGKHNAINVDVRE